MEVIIMPKIKLAKMTKRLNSISRTLLAATSPITVRLKESTSIHSPVFILENQNAFDNDYNYIVLLDEHENPKFYYWVEDKVAVTNNITEWHCSLDPLATYHDQILHTTAFLSYADENHWDPLLDDPRLAPDCEVSHREWPAEGNANTHPYTDLPLKHIFSKPNLNDLVHESSWTVFLTVCGTQVADLQNPLYGFSGCTVYAMPMPLYRVVMEKNSNTVVTTVGDFFDDLSPTDPIGNLEAIYEAMSRTLCTIFDGGVPLDNVLSVMAVPISFYDVLCFPNLYDPNEGTIDDQYNDDIWEQTDKMLIGSFPVDLSDMEEYVYKAANLWLSGSFRDLLTGFHIPYLKCTERYKFLRLPKYTKVTVYHPCGQADISDKAFENDNYCNVEGSVDVFNGLYTVNINSNIAIPDSRVVTNLSGNLGYDFAWYNKMGEKTDALKIQDDARGALLNLTSSLCGAITRVNVNGPEFSQTQTVAASKNDTIIAGDALAQSNAAARMSIQNTYSPGKTATSRTVNPTGIAGVFQPASQTCPTREFNSSGSLLNCFLCRTDDNGKLIFTCSVEHFFPSIFMDERSGHEGMCYLDNNGKAIRYEEFCKEYGYVCNKRLMLSECFDEEHNPAKTCFVKAEGASFYPDSTTTCTPSVISTINSFLNSGIYLEK